MNYQTRKSRQREAKKNREMFAALHRPASNEAKTKNRGNLNHRVNDYSPYSAGESHMNELPLVPSTPLTWPIETAKNTIEKMGYVSLEEHNAALSKIAKLSHDLDGRIKEAETASKICRDLSSWTHIERSRLLHDMEAAKSEAASKMEDAVEKERSVLNAGTRRFLELEINKARTEVGLAPLSQAEMFVRINAATNFHNYSVNKEHAEPYYQPNAPSAKWYFTKKG